MDENSNEQKTTLDAEQIMHEAEERRQQNLVFEKSQYEEKLAEIGKEKERLTQHIASFVAMRACMSAPGAHIPLNPSFSYESKPEYVEAKAFIEDTRMWQAINEHTRFLEGYKVQEKMITDELARINDEMSKQDTDTEVTTEEKSE